MPFSFGDLVNQFLTSRRVLEYQTEEFVTLQHDRDLVTGTNNQLSRIAESYGYFTALTFETQGINDNGSDVSVRYRNLGADEDAPTRVLGFQIKSHVELASPDTLAKLKAQRDDAFRKIPDLAHYYILLCGHERKLKKRLNAIRAEFLKADRTTVVSPVHVLRFLWYKSFQVDAQVKRLMEESDVVLKEMYKSLETSSDTAKALVCYLAANLLSSGTPTVAVSDLRDGILGRLYRSVVEAARERERTVEEARKTAEAYHDLGDEIDSFYEDDDGNLAIVNLDPETALAIDIEQLSGEFTEQSPDGSSVTLMINAAAPVIAVAADAMVRYGYGQAEVVPYLLDLAGVEL